MFSGAWKRMMWKQSSNQHDTRILSKWIHSCELAKEWDSAICRKGFIRVGRKLRNNASLSLRAFLFVDLCLDRAATGSNVRPELAVSDQRETRIAFNFVLYFHFSLHGILSEGMYCYKKSLIPWNEQFLKFLFPMFTIWKVQFCLYNIYRSIDVMSVLKRSLSERSKNSLLEGFEGLIIL